jgi:tRNA 2-thiocytidine biosynthesis protein TtcA
MADAQARLRRMTRFYLRKVNRAIACYHQIEAGDRLAVAVSGGKDSLTLLRLLRERLELFLPAYELLAIHVSYSGWDVGAPTREELAAHFEREGVPYAFAEVDFTGEQVDCFRCSWQRRKALFRTAQEHGCNKLALAHHLEDVVEATLLNLLFHGRFERPEPFSPLFGGKLTIIRPLVFLKDHDVNRYARAAGLPVKAGTCPYAETGQRARMRAWLREFYRVCPELYINVFRAVEKYSPRVERPPRAVRASETAAGQAALAQDAADPG